MKKKKKCLTCGKKMFFCKEVVGHYICRRCGYPDTEKITMWQRRHREAQKPRRIFRVVIDRITGGKKLFVKEERRK